MIQYLSLFIPKFGSKTVPLKPLLKKDTKFEWDGTHEKAFQKLKYQIHENFCLPYFLFNAKTVIQVDSSMLGLGATLINDNKIIAFVSKKLTDAETRYANIERVHIEKIPDQMRPQPFENILNKNVAQAPPRLQGMLLRLQLYDTKNIYEPGKEMNIPDYLLRIQPTQSEEIELGLTIHTADITVKKQNDSQKAEEEKKILKQVIINRWLEVKITRKLIRNHLSFEFVITLVIEFLSVQDGLVTKGHRHAQHSPSRNP